MTRSRHRHVWVVGSRDDLEFQPLLDWLSETTEVRFATGRETTLPDSWLDPAHDGATWVVFVSARPDSVSRESVERWQRWFPLARFVVVLGSWCEGETRTGRPWPGVARVYWHQLLPRLVASIADEEDSSAEWRLARTTTEAEQLDMTLAHTPRVVSKAPATLPPLRNELIAIWSPTTLGWETIADACQACGVRSARWDGTVQEIPAGARGVVIDMPRSMNATDSIWQECAWRVLGIPALALVGFPRWEDRLALERLGVSLLSKPWRLVDFHRHLVTQLDKASSIRGVG